MNKSSTSKSRTYAILMGIGKDASIKAVKFVLPTDEQYPGVGNTTQDAVEYFTYKLDRVSCITEEDCYAIEDLEGKDIIFIKSYDLHGDLKDCEGPVDQKKSEIQIEVSGKIASGKTLIMHIVNNALISAGILDIKIHSLDGDFRNGTRIEERIHNMKDILKVSIKETNTK